MELVAAATAGFHGEAVRRAVDGMLAAGQAPDEVLEVLLHLVPFVGFARVLRAVGVAVEVFSEHGVEVMPVRPPVPTDRYGRGRALMREIAGPRAEAVLRSLEDVAPDLARMLVEVTYGDVYSRPGLGTPRRLLATVTALVALGDTKLLLEAQTQAARSWGWHPTQLEEIADRVAPLVDPRAVAEARAVLAGSS